MKAVPKSAKPKRGVGAKLSGGVLAVLIGLVGAFEGYKNYAYTDPVGIPTICFGYTSGVKLGDYKTKEECTALLVEELEVANKAVSRCLGDGLSDNERVAYTSLVYNTGPKAVCEGSTIYRKFHYGDREGACNAIKLWVYAKGVKLPGLVNRRAEESKICLSQ